MQKELTVVIPSFNEEESLKDNLNEIIKFIENENFELIIINDGSTDKTDEVVLSQINNKNVKYLKHKRNRGYGAAVKYGIENCDTKYVITFDADGQHSLQDIKKLFNRIKETDADLVIGSRTVLKENGIYKRIGKSIIRRLSKILIQNKIKDLNTGMKIMRTDLAKKYITICPDTFAFCDVSTLIFVSEKNIVIEEPIETLQRLKGESKISVNSAFETVMEIINISVLFNPMKIFLPIALFLTIPGFFWSLRIVLMDRGVSVGGSMLIVLGIMCFLIGLVAEQLSFIKKRFIK